MTSTSLPEGRPVYVWRLLIDCRVHDPAVGSTVPPKWNRHPKLLTMLLSSYHSSVVKVPHFPRETKNRCKPLSFASAQVQARSLGCTVCPAHGGLNDLLADYTQAGFPVKGGEEIGHRGRTKDERRRAALRDDWRGRLGPLGGLL